MNLVEHPAAEAADHLFQQLAPQAAATVRPFLPRLFHALDEGHSYITVSVSEAQQLAQAQPLVQTRNAPLLLQNQRLFIAKYRQLEQDLAHEIHRLNQQTLPAPNTTMQQQLAAWFSDSGSQDQQAAAALALISPFILISGGPGTGKTTTVAKLLALLCQQNDRLPEILLAAPTGKAAARMTEALHRALVNISDLPKPIAEHLYALNAQTVHRLLALTPPQMQARYHAQNPLAADILLLDEASMLDTELLQQLLHALPDSCRVILLGDANQLPAIGMGAVLTAFNHAPPLNAEQQQKMATLLPHNRLPENVAQQHARLTISHRFNAQSGIGQLAQAVLSGDADGAWKQFAQFPEQLHHTIRSHNQIAAQLQQKHQTYWQYIAENNIQAAFDCLNQRIVLTATRQDAEQINQAYQALVASDDASFFHGQIIMISRNDHVQKLYNGDIGIVHQHGAHLVASFQDTQQLRHIPINRLPECETAFAITVHKSQGSEYQSVWFVAPTQTQQLNRALLYTALTRAKQHFTYFGDAHGFHAACTQQENRRSLLAQDLFGQQNELQAA